MEQGDVDHDGEASLASLPPASGTRYGTPAAAVPSGTRVAAVLTVSNSEFLLKSAGL